MTARLPLPRVWHPYAVWVVAFLALITVGPVLAVPLYAVGLLAGPRTFGGAR